MSLYTATLIIVFPFSVLVIVHDEIIPTTATFSYSSRSRGRTPVCRPLCSSFCRLLRYRIASVDPIRIDVDGSREIYFMLERRPLYPFISKLPRTVDIRLECLTADLAMQIPDTRLLLDGHGNRVLVVAEQALEGCRELVLLLWRLAVILNTTRAVRIPASDPGLSSLIFVCPGSC
jgi:hypothetical protein